MRCVYDDEDEKLLESLPRHIIENFANVEENAEFLHSYILPFLTYPYHPSFLFCFQLDNFVYIPKASSVHIPPLQRLQNSIRNEP